MKISRLREAGLLALMFAIWGVVFLDRMNVLYLAPFLVRELKLTTTQVGELASAMAVTWAFSSLILGAVSDKVGRVVVLVPCMLGTSLLALGCFFVHAFWQLLVLRLLMGVASGPVATVLFALVEQNSDPMHRGRNAGILISAAALVGRAVGPVYSTQIAALWGWRWALALAGFIGVVLAVLALLIPDRRAAVEAGHGHAHGPAAWGDMLTVLRYRNIWLSCAGAAGVLAWMFVFNSFGSLYLVEAHHYAATTAGWVIGWVGMGGFVQSLIYPSFSDRFGRRRILLILTCFCILLPIVFSSNAFTAHSGLLAIAGFLANAGEGTFAFFLILIPTESVPARQAGAAIGMTMLVGELIGGTLMPAVAGSLSQQFGLGAALWVAGAGGLVALIAAACLRETKVAAMQQDPA